jgi:hypothetical protein
MALSDEQRAAKRERDRRYYATAKGTANRLRKNSYGTRNPMSEVGRQPHHQPGVMPDAESVALARQQARVQDEPDRVYAPTASSNPANPRTSAASYYSQTQVLLMEWGDGGVPYAYYDVTPQEWDAFTRADSPGRFINNVLNEHNYGPAGPRTVQTGERAGERRTGY